MADRNSIKDISLRVLDFPIIQEREFHITSGVIELGRKITIRYFGEIPLTAGSQFIADTENGRYRVVAGKRIRPHGRYATVISRVNY